MDVNPFRRPGESPQVAGNRFERFWARVFGVEPTRGSGNQWFAKLDVPDGGAILWSCKSTDAESFRLTKATMREAQEAATGMGSSGETIPGVATAVDGEVLVTLRAEDFLRMFTANVKYITPSKGEQKRLRAKVPELLREDDE